MIILIMTNIKVIEEQKLSLTICLAGRCKIKNDCQKTLKI